VPETIPTASAGTRQRERGEAARDFHHVVLVVLQLGHQVLALVPVHVALPGSTFRQRSRNLLSVHPVAKYGFSGG
jgi:hypothetical protein